MPTVTRTFDAADQEQQAERWKAAAVVEVWRCDSPAGCFVLRRLRDKYALDGNGLRLFGQDDPFGPDIPIHAVNDDDAVRSAKLLILSRAKAEVEQMSAVFFPVVGECGWGNDERLPPCGKPSCDWCVAKGTVRAPASPPAAGSDEFAAGLTDEPPARADTAAEAAALA